MTRLALAMASLLFCTTGFTAEQKCHDLHGNFALMGHDPELQTGATVIDFEREGLSVRQVPEEGIPFDEMGGGRHCYINGRIPPRNEKGEPIYVGITPAEEIVRVANCGNTVETTYRFPTSPPVIPPPQIADVPKTIVLPPYVPPSAPPPTLTTVQRILYQPPEHHGNKGLVIGGVVVAAVVVVIIVVVGHENAIKPLGNAGGEHNGPK